MKTWAEHEVERACNKENPDWDGKSFDYGCSCYQSALKAYKSLMEDKHSGMSFAFTRSILTRLMERLPLTPITEDDFKDAPKDIPEEDDAVLKLRKKKSCLLKQQWSFCVTVNMLFRLWSNLNHKFLLIL